MLIWFRPMISTVPSMWEIILNAGNILPDLPVLPELLSSCRIWRDSGQTEDIFIQAAQQLEGTPVTLFKMGGTGCTDDHKFLEENLKEGMCLGFDAVLSAQRKPGN